MSDPCRALDNFRDGLAYTRQHRLPFFEAATAMSSACLEAVHGHLHEALDLFTTSLDSFHQSGNTTDLDLAFAYLMVFFDRIGQPEVAATLSGTFVDKPGSLAYTSFVTHVDHVRKMLDTDTFDNCVRSGAAMTSTEAVHYAHHHIQLAREHRTGEPPAARRRHYASLLVRYGDATRTFPPSSVWLLTLGDPVSDIGPQPDASGRQ